MGGRPTVILPVFNAVDELAICVAALASTLSGDDRIVVCDDASTDPGVSGLLEAFCSRTVCSVQIQRRNSNLGFVQNVNLALADNAGADVVLLNSDTRVTPGWLDRIIECANTDPRIATITPWSNNAEICSFPLFCQINRMPDDIDAIAQAAATLPNGDFIDLPTAVGFCMYIRRAALAAVGDFDAATFGRGYGEENDFCMRASAHGWRHVLGHRAFVAHRGNASFGPLGEQPCGENLQRLLARYPAYNRLIAEFIRRDPPAAWRAALTQVYSTEATLKKARCHPGEGRDPA